MTNRPWYPSSWLDADGNPLPEVHEVTPGEWPPCKPGDLVEVIMAFEREERAECKHNGQIDAAGGYNWDGFPVYPGTIVAIRIIQKAGT